LLGVVDGGWRRIVASVGMERLGAVAAMEAAMKW
jgi:hypothetical protein